MDEQLHGRIEELVSEEHSLWERRALREAGLDPAAARVRDPEVVEHYQQ